MYVYAVAHARFCGSAGGDKHGLNESSKPCCPPPARHAPRPGDAGHDDPRTPPAERGFDMESSPRQSSVTTMHLPSRHASRAGYDILTTLRCGRCEAGRACARVAAQRGPGPILPGQYPCRASMRKRRLIRAQLERRGTLRSSSSDHATCGPSQAAARHATMPQGDSRW
jgi:hypothetical protein